MPRKNPHAVALGKRTSARKNASSARNGLKGGRPSIYRLTRAGGLERRDDSGHWISLEPPLDEAAKAFMRRNS